MKEELQTIQNLALAFDALQAVLTTLNCAENIASDTSQGTNGNSAVNNDYQVQLSIVNSDSTIASSPTTGLAEIQGTVDVTSNLGIEVPQSGIDLNPGPNGETISTMADPSGNYDLLGPLGISGFNYASSQLTLVDPKTTAL